MDITFGNPIDFDHSTLARNAVTRGGILLRSIRRVSDGKVTSGPSLLVDEILRATGAEDIGELVNKRWKRDISALPPSSSSDAPKRESALYFKRKEASSASGTQGNLHRFFGGGSGSSSTIGERKVYRSPRIGLDLSHSSIPQDTPGALAHSRANYIIRRYRFFSHPNLLTAKGQGHTFLGVYHFLLHSGIKESDEKAFCRELLKVTGMKEATVAKYWAQYKDGLHNGVLKPFLGQSGKGVTSSPTSFLKLMGTLRKHQSRPVESTSDKAEE